MTGSCDTYQEKIAALLAGDLSAADVRLVEEHVNTCETCRRYRDGLQQDDRLLKSFVQSVDDGMNGLEAKIMETINTELADQTALRQNEAANKASIFRCRVMRVVAAAVVLIGIVASADLIFKSDGSAVVWADVMQQVEDARDFICRIRQDKSIDTDLNMVEYRSARYGYRVDMYQQDSDKLAGSQYLRPGETLMYVLVHRDKTYMLVELTEEQRDQMMEGSSAKEMVRQFRSMKFEELGRKEIEGKTVTGIEIKNPPEYTAVFEECTLRLWVDVRTNWPVRIEMDGAAMDGDARIKSVIDRFQWNPSLSAEDFEFEVPDDYKKIARMDAVQADEASAIEGLREYVRFSGGRYPGSMAFATALHELDDEIAELRRRGDWSEEVFSNIMKIQNTCEFYADLLENEQDATYYGEDVGPRDYDRVLLRWRTEDGRYRVVYGDLRVEDVSAERLEELEDQD
jgi:outer membrane lipoprotein-sorting protein